MTTKEAERRFPSGMTTKGALAERRGQGSGAGVELFGEFGVDFADRGDMGEGAGVVEAVGHGEVLGVVGDGDVTQSAGDGGLCHLADGVAAVGGVGVHVEVAAYIPALDERREGVQRGGFEFAAVLAEFGRNPVEVEGVVDGGFRVGFGSDDLVICLIA